MPFAFNLQTLLTLSLEKRKKWGGAKPEERKSDCQAETLEIKHVMALRRAWWGNVGCPQEPMLEKDNLECPQHFGRFFVLSFLGAPEPSLGVILWDQVSDGQGRDRRSEQVHPPPLSTSVCPAKAASPGAGHFAGKVRAQSGVFPQAMGTSMPQFLQKMHEFLPAKLTCSRMHSIGWKARPERWESVVPGPLGTLLLLRWLPAETGAGAESLESAPAS